MSTEEETKSAPTEAPSWRPIPSRQRRILGVLMEKAKTTPDAYPLSLSSLVAGANQKSNRYPLMNLTPEQVEDELSELRRLGAAAEIQGSGRVPRYRHYGHAWLGVKGVEAAVMTELLLRGHQTAGDLRTRASRFEPIADLGTLNGILQSLIERKLVIALTSPGRGQLFSHNLYTPDELQALRGKIAAGDIDVSEDQSGDSTAGSMSGGGAAIARPSGYAAVQPPAASAEAQAELAQTRAEVAQLRSELSELRQALAEFEQRLGQLEQAKNA